MWWQRWRIRGKRWKSWRFVEKIESLLERSKNARIKVLRLASEDVPYMFESCYCHDLRCE
jgi:hypothetical protein